ncbi:MAG: hypothetical protein LBU20_00330 [Candidatus Nomurabacteria bacterium]|jgi:hypothetical protein|nr:hypothetical protein [Candidatus Nomurabacteria bacterium]
MMKMLVSAAKQIKRKLYKVKDRAGQRRRLAAAGARLGDLPAGDYFVAPPPGVQITQWASPKLVSDILDGRVKAADDPNWRDFGFATTADYDFWSWRICGLMCVKAVLDAYHLAERETVASLTEKGVALGGYKVKQDEGWFYAPLVKLARSFGLMGQVYGALSLEEIATAILDNHFIIASVHPGVIRGDLDRNPHDGKGHLVLTHGFRWDGVAISGFFINNPSGRTAKTQQKAFIPIKNFREAFAGKGFSLWEKSLL